MMKIISRRYIQAFVMFVSIEVSPAWGVIYQNGNVSFLGAAVKQACTAEIRHQDQVDLEYTIELDECPWSQADELRVIVSTSQNVGRISSSTPDNIFVYSGSRIPGHYSLSFPGQAFDSKEASVITVYYP